MARSLSPLPRIGLVVVMLALVLTAGGLALVPAIVGLGDLSRGTPSSIELDHLSQRSYVYAKDGTLLAVLRAEENRESVALEDIPDHVVDAILAVEDAAFWSHKGVNVRATARALVSNVESGEITQGGSTITQQLVKNALVGSRQDFERKTKEAFLALRLEKQMSKEAILERYLNTVYFGNSAYGVQAAAETYFGESVRDIDIAQAALLAGLIRNPNEYDPFESADVASERRRIALGRMLAEGMITEAEFERHNRAPLPQTRSEYEAPPDTYFVESVKQSLLDDPRLGETATERYDAVFRGGLRIETTLDPAVQSASEQARDEVLAPFALEGEPALFIAGTDLQGEDAIGTVAFTVLDTHSGAVRAMVGGPRFDDDYKFNLATQGYRQTGSAFKIFVLLELLEQGRSVTDTADGTSPCTFKIPGVAEPYEVENFGRGAGFVGSIMSLTLASSNCGFVRLGQIAGIDNVVELAGEMGIRTRNAANEIVPLDPTIFSTPLGTQEVAPIDMAGAVASVGNEGIFNPPYLVERVLDGDGDVIFDHSSHGERVVSEDTAAIAADVLRRNVLGGTGGNARVAGHDAGGKTGTAQDFSNGWFAGFTEYYTAAVWMGAIEGNVPMRRVGGRSVTGGSWPAMIWGRLMTALHEDLEPRDFPTPPSRRSTGKLELPPEIDISTSTTTTSTTVVDESTTTSGPSIPPDASTTSTEPPATTTTGITAPPPDEDIGD